MMGKSAGGNVQRGLVDGEVSGSGWAGGSGGKLRGRGREGKWMRGNSGGGNVERGEVEVDRWGKWSEVDGRRS